MALKLSQMFHWIRAELAGRRPVADSMSHLIDQCEAVRPHVDWTRLRSLPYGEIEPVRRWVETRFHEDPPDFPLKGLWFGLHNPIRDDNPVADLRVSGAQGFDPADNDWAVNAPWWPIGRNAHSEILAEIYRIAYPPGISREERRNYLGNDAEYPLCLGYGAFALREVFSQLDPSLILGESDSVGVTVGFDSGDFLHVGTVTPSGFVTAG